MRAGSGPGLPRARERASRLQAGAGRPHARAGLARGRLSPVCALFVVVGGVGGWGGLGSRIAYSWVAERGLGGCTGSPGSALAPQAVHCLPACLLQAAWRIACAHIHLHKHILGVRMCMRLAQHPPTPPPLCRPRTAQTIAAPNCVKRPPTASSSCRACPPRTARTRRRRGRRGSGRGANHRHSASTPPATCTTTTMMPSRRRCSRQPSTARTSTRPRGLLRSRQRCSNSSTTARAATRRLRGGHRSRRWHRDPRSPMPST